MIVKEGLVYALNSSFGVSVGGAPTPKTQFYLFLSTANRNWSENDIAETINTVADEFELYDEATRPEWDPQALALPASINLDSSGAEATYTIGDLTALGGSVTIYGAGIISASAKDGSSDDTATLVAGSRFATPRVLLEDDVFNVGAVLSAADDGA